MSRLDLLFLLSAYGSSSSASFHKVFSVPLAVAKGSLTKEMLSRAWLEDSKVEWRKWRDASLGCLLCNYYINQLVPKAWCWRDKRCMIIRLKLLSQRARCWLNSPFIRDCYWRLKDEIYISCNRAPLCSIKALKAAAEGSQRQKCSIEKKYFPPLLAVFYLY